MRTEFHTETVSPPVKNLPQTPPSPTHEVSPTGCSWSSATFHRVRLLAARSDRSRPSACERKRPARAPLASWEAQKTPVHAKCTSFFDRRRVGECVSGTRGAHPFPINSLRTHTGQTRGPACATADSTLLLGSPRTRHRTPSPSPSPHTASHAEPPSPETQGPSPAFPPTSTPHSRPSRYTRETPRSGGPFPHVARQHSTVRTVA